MAERTLRERCIEAGARRLRKVGLADVKAQSYAADFLDAILGVLTEHADEMAEAHPEVWGVTANLLAVLGGDE